jgi:plastocyanin
MRARAAATVLAAAVAAGPACGGGGGDEGLASEPVPADPDAVIRADGTPLEQGKSQRALTVTLPVGEYEFVCDIHPAMTGEMVAG